MEQENSNNLSERKLTIKRKYTDLHPAQEVGASAKVRNKVLEAIKDGKITKAEFDKLVSEFSKDARRWLQRNAQYFNVSEDGISLSKSGSRILNQIKTNTEPKMKKLVMESFSDFVALNSVNEDLLVESTRSQIGVIDKRGNITSTYVHYDGYPEGVGAMAKKHYSDTKKMKELLKLGKSGISFLEPGIEGGDGHSFKNPTAGQTVFYGRDRGEKRNTIEKGRMSDVRDYLSDALYYCDYVYLWHEGEKQWYMASNGMRNLEVFESSNYIVERRPRGRQAKDSEGVELYKNIHRLFSDMRVDKTGGNKDKSLKENPAALAEKYCEDMVEAIKKALAHKYKAAAGMQADVDKSQAALAKVLPAVEAFMKKPNKSTLSKAFQAKVFWWGQSNGALIGLDGEWGEDNIIESVESDEEMVTEALKSSKLRNLMNMSGASNNYWGSRNKQHGLAKAFYGLTKIKLDTLEDSAFIDYENPQRAFKELSKDEDFVVFYIVDAEKSNPHYDDWSYKTLYPGLLALTRGKEFLTVKYDSNDQNRISKSGASGGQKYGSRRTLSSAKGSDMAGAVGGSKKYKGSEGSGISSVKRAAELADRAIAINIKTSGESSYDQREARLKSKEGAVAFKSAADFKKANRARYEEILANKAASLPLDKMVNDAIDQITDQIKDGLAKNEIGRYGDVIIGRDPKGRECRMRDASNHMSQILDKYSRYVEYSVKAKQEKESGYSSGYYEREVKNYAKKLKTDISKVKNLNYVW